MNNDTFELDEELRAEFEKYAECYCRHIDILTKTIHREVVYSVKIFTDFLIGNLSDEIINANYDTLMAEYEEYYHKRTGKPLDDSFERMWDYFYGIYQSINDDVNKMYVIYWKDKDSDETK